MHPAHHFVYTPGIPDRNAKGPLPIPEPEPTSLQQAAAHRLSRIQADLWTLERRDWWLWIVAIAVSLLLVLPAFLLTVPGPLKETDWFYQFKLQQAVRGLFGLVLLFNAYVIYQQVLIKRLRTQLAGQIMAMATLEMRAEELQNLAIQDPLTGLYNRRFAEKQLETELLRARRSGQPLTVATFDLNNFKEINDRLGHAVGDLVLRVFAERLKKASRGSDLGVRMGGDEFLIILPDCSGERVEHLLVRLRGLSVDFRGELIPVDFSVGWASCEAGESRAELLERADRALYADKRTQKASR